jgi:hypothetical protein
MEANKLRLNQQKRQLLKREWANTVWNKTPMEVEDNLKLAIDNYRTVKQQTWDNVITPIMDKKFPLEDMDILAKYDRGQSHYRSFTEIDQCFYFKPTHTDTSESQYKWTIDDNEMRALYHFELQGKGHQATLEVEYDETKRDRNPHYHEKTKAMEEDLSKVSASLDRGLWNQSGYHRYDRGGYKDDISHFSRIVPNTGGCHSRTMMCEEHHWEQLKMYAKAQSSLTNAHRELWQMKYELVKDMNSIIDQAKFLSDVKEYWPDVQECVSFETSDISRELSIVSDDTKERLRHSLAVRQTAREQQPKEVEVVVPTQGFALVN